jgi:hypothetical protein
MGKEGTEEGRRVLNAPAPSFVCGVLSLAPGAALARLPVSIALGLQVSFLSFSSKKKTV